MSAVYVSNLVINSGTTFDQDFDLIKSNDSGPLNLSGFSVTAQIRKHAGSNKKTDFSTAVVDASNGQIKISLSATDTASLKSGRHLYDVVITNGAGEKTRVIEGSVLVREGVTR